MAASTGDGPVDATYKAINEIVKADLKLIDYQIKSVTKGEGAQGEVTIRVKKGEMEVTARGISTDIIEASAKAYLNALAKIENMKVQEITGGIAMPMNIAEKILAAKSGKETCGARRAGNRRYRHGAGKRHNRADSDKGIQGVGRDKSMGQDEGSPGPRPFHAE